MEFYSTDELKDGVIVLQLDHTCDAQPEKRWLPAYYFNICLPDGTRIGNCDLRIGHYDKTYIGGNVGYGIEEPYRGHHYAAKACRLLFGLAKKHGMPYLLITCAPTNLPSRRTCEYLGGKLLEIVELPESHDLRVESGHTHECVYRFDL